MIYRMMPRMEGSRILVVEDDGQVSDVVVYMLEKHGFEVPVPAHDAPVQPPVASC